MSLTRIALRLGAVLVLAGCASAGGSGGASSGSNRTVLGAEQLHAETGKTLHDVIRQHRPQWLMRRGQMSLNYEGDIVVYMDGSRMGGPDVLRNIPAESVESVRLLSAGEATTRFGTGHAHGAIVIASRRS